jgi:hypothetical protein
VLLALLVHLCSCGWFLTKTLSNDEEVFCCFFSTEALPQLEKYKSTYLPVQKYK